jgi:septal ring factor EnvC (AmiA/AmiB activator)
LNEAELSGLKLEKQQTSEQLVLSREALEQTTTQFKTQCGHLEDRVSELSQQNAAVHEEAEKVCLHAV